jgi:hypothetical protein
MHTAQGKQQVKRGELKLTGGVAILPVHPTFLKPIVELSMRFREHANRGRHHFVNEVQVDLWRDGAKQDLFRQLPRARLCARAHKSQACCTFCHDSMLAHCKEELYKLSIVEMV